MLAGFTRMALFIKRGSKTQTLTHLFLHKVAQH